MIKKKIWELGRPDIETYKGTEKLPVALIIDNVRSLNNIGSLFRTADAFLIERIVLCGISATPPSVEIHKTALGAEDSVAWQYFESSLEAAAKFKEEGYGICVLEQVNGSVPLQDFAPESGKRYAIVVGNEIEGVSQQVVNVADYCLEIPQFGTKHSLNVSVSAAIAMWHFFNILKL